MGDFPLLPTIEVNPDAPSWYAVRTRSQHEKKVASQLEEKGVTAFVPLLDERRRWSDRHQLVRLPLFPGYVFVHIVPSAGAYVYVLRTPGVAHFVGIGRIGIPIPDKEIEDIRAVLTHRRPCGPYPYLSVGQRVRVRGGVLDGVEGILLAQNSDRTLVLSVDLIQRSLALRIEGYAVEAI